MIYPDVTLDEWLKRHPDLKVKEGICDNWDCKKPMRTTRPFVYRDGVGLESNDCECGKSKHRSSVMIVTRPEAVEQWREILGGL